MSTETPPFDRSYVMKVTLSKMLKNIDTSFHKTSARLEEFDEKSEKWHEVFATLHSLHTIRRTLEEFEIANKDLFTKSHNEEENND